MISSLTLEQLRVFTAVVDEGSFSAAGRRLRRVQSAVSQSIQTLELGLGLALFDRSSKIPALTDAGRALLGQARQVLRETAALQAQAMAIGAGMEPDLTLAVDSLFPSPPLLSSLQALRLRFPDIPVTLYTEPILAAERRLREGAASIGLFGLRPGDAADVVALPLTAIEMTPVAAPGHPLARLGEPLSRDEMSRYVQLILTDPSAAPDAPAFGVLSPRVWRFVDLGRRLDFLRAGFGWGNMPSHMVAGDIASGGLARLELAEPSLLPRRIPIFAVHARVRPPGPAGRWLLDRLVEACRG
jgi:DNA-binding transcriptional LysR family regulator